MGRKLKFAGLLFGALLFSAPALAELTVAGFKRSSVQAKSAEGDDRALLNKSDVTFPLTIKERDLAKKLVLIEIGDKSWWVREVDVIAPGLEVHEATECHAGEQLVAKADTQLGATQMGLGGRCKPAAE